MVKPPPLSLHTVVICGITERFKGSYSVQGSKYDNTPDTV